MSSVHPLHHHPTRQPGPPRQHNQTACLQLQEKALLDLDHYLKTFNTSLYHMIVENDAPVEMQRDTGDPDVGAETDVDRKLQFQAKRYAMHSDALNAICMINVNDPEMRTQLQDILDDTNCVFYDRYTPPLPIDEAQLLSRMGTANTVCTPHVTEAYSPPCVTSLAHRFGLRPGLALDLTTVGEHIGA